MTELEQLAINYVVAREQYHNAYVDDMPEEVLEIYQMDKFKHEVNLANYVKFERPEFKEMMGIKGDQTVPNFEETDRMALQASFDPIIVERPTIVCLCGSTKFWRTFQRAGLQETMKGNIVLSIGAAAGTDDEHFGNLSPAAYEAIKDKLDVLHYHKIFMADEILVLDELKDGQPYIGTSTAAEIAFARRMGKNIRYWSKEIK